MTTQDMGFAVCVLNAFYALWLTRPGTVEDLVWQARMTRATIWVAAALVIGFG